MQSIQALRERIAARAQEVRKLVEDNNNGWKPEHQTAYDTGMAEIEDLKAQVKRIEAANDALADDKLNSSLAEAAGRRAPAGKGEKARAIYDKWLRGGDRALTAEDWNDIRATMSTTTTTEGGYAVQTDVSSMLINALKAFGGMREVATVIRTAQGNPMSFPSSDGTSETGEQIAENTTATGADPTFGTVGLNVYKFSSKIVAAPFELLQDATVDVEAFINRRLAQRLGRITNTRFTTGSGSSQPNGVVTATSAGKTGTTGQTTTVIFDDLVDLIHSVDPEYRKSKGVRFMMHDLSLAKIRKLKDSQNRPIFLPGYDGLAGPMPDTVLGYQVTINQDVAQMAANAKSILFGDFSQYYIRDAMDVTMFRFTDSAYAKLGQVGFLAWMRSGGNLLDAGAIKQYVNSAT
jgi:HK97 family phage major capsid protein